MWIELLLVIGGTIFLLLTVILTLYAVRLRKSDDLIKLRTTMAASELTRRASSVGELVNRLNFNLEQIGTWIQEPLPAAHRETKLDRKSYLLYAEIEYLLNSIEVSGFAETDDSVKKQFCEALVKTAELAIYFGNYAHALRHLKRALAFGEDYLASIGISATDIYFSLGVAYSQWGHEDKSKSFVEEAIRYFEKTLKRRHNLESSMHNVAWSFDELARLTGDKVWFEKAVATYRELLTVKPQFERARFNLACALRRLERFEEAFEELERIPGNHDLWDYITSDEDFTDLPPEWKKRLESLAGRKKKQAEVVLPS